MHGQVVAKVTLKGGVFFLDMAKQGHPAARAGNSRCNAGRTLCASTGHSGHDRIELTLFIERAWRRLA
jgi:hypothetical protein